MLRWRGLQKNLSLVFLCICCFALGNWLSYFKMAPDCIHHLDPHHKDIPELRDGFHGLKHLKAFLVVIIPSVPRNSERRQVLRDTWLKTPKKIRENILHFFVIGNEDLPADVQSQLDEENETYKDILELPVLDTYSKLTDKVLQTFVKMDLNVEFNYLLKCDEDTYIRLGDLYDELQNSNYRDSLYWGFFDGRAPVFRSGKWAEKDYVLCDRYIPYAVGGAYILSANLVHFLAENADQLKLYNSEDVSVGTWLAPLKVHRVHDVRFDTEWKSRGCSNQYLVTHKQSVQEIKDKEYAMTATGVMCTKEKQDRMSYKYNWDTVPSKCCVKNDSSIP